MLLASSHVVLATNDVSKATRFFSSVFEIKPHFENNEFSEFVLPSGYRIAFFRPVGKSSEHFATTQGKKTVGIGLTVENVEAFFKKLEPLLEDFGAQVSGPPKSHPWGEKSFLLIDPDGNRWEITQSPTKSGLLVDR